MQTQQYHKAVSLKVTRTIISQPAELRESQMQHVVAVVHYDDDLQLIDDYDRRFLRTGKTLQSLG